MKNFLWFLILSASAVGQQLYEEDPLASMPIREKQWKQMQAYVETLDSSPEPLHQILRNRIGYPPPGLFAKVKERLEKIGEDEVATYYRCYISISPEMESYGLYIVPKNVKLPRPLVIAQHGGGGFPEMATFKGGANYHDMVRGAVDEGYIVFAPHHIFYPYRDRDNGSPIPENVRAQLDERLRSRGTSLAAVEVAKISKALDALLERPEVDRKRVAMIGLSYGGFYTLYTAALDTRIGVAVASCSFRDTAETSDPAPKPEGRLIDLSGPELVELISPRALQIQSGINDKSFPIDNVRQAVAKAEKFYNAAGVSDMFNFEAFEGVHEFRGDIAWLFLKKHL